MILGWTPIRQHPHFAVLLNRVGLDEVAVASYKKVTRVPAQPSATLEQVNVVRPGMGVK